MQTLPLIVWYLDDPVADPALVPLYFIAREARKHVKVVLSGEGADELFGGYTIYREPISLRAFEHVPAPIKRGLGRLSTKIPEGTRGKDLLRRGSIGIEERYYGNARIFRPDEMGFLRRFDPSVSYQDVTRELYANTTHLDGSTRMQYVDLFTWLRGDILVKADKMTMANSLELRVPFLDTVVYEVGSSIPTSQKITKETTKYALRRALELIVPAHVINRPKLGFPVPIRHWLKDVMYDWAREIVDRVAGGRAHRPGRGAAPDRRAPRRPARLLAQDLDAAGVPDLARDLRRGPHPARDPRAGVPRPALMGRMHSSLRAVALVPRPRSRWPQRRRPRPAGGRSAGTLPPLTALANARPTPARASWSPGSRLRPAARHRSVLRGRSTRAGTSDSAVEATVSPVGTGESR